MKNKILLGMFASALLLAGCDYNEDNFPGYDDDTHYKDIQNIDLKLEDSEYKKIAEVEKNKGIALEKDPEGQTFLSALEAIGKNKYFTEDAQAAWYLPAYLDVQYPYLSDGSKVTIQYNNFENLPDYMADFNNVSKYELSAADYKAVWGESVSASFLSPSTVKEIPAILSEEVSGAKDGALCLVNYAYSETEPSTGGGAETTYVYRQTDEFNEAGGAYVIAAKGTDGKYYPFGKLADGKNYGYMYPDPITVTSGIINTEEGSAQKVVVEKTATGYSLLNEWGQYLYMSGNYNNFNVKTALPAEGGDWKFGKNVDGTFSITNVEKGKTVKLTLFNGSYSFGSYPAETFAGKEYLKVATNDEDGAFTIQNVSMEGMERVWEYTGAKYGWKASAFVDNTNKPSESWIVSPEIDLTDSKNPVFNADMALNFLKGGTLSDYISVKVSENYAGDVTTATWTDLEIAEWPAGTSWSFVNSGDADLSNYKDKKIRIAFKYTSTAEKAPTFEVKNICVKEQVNYWDVYLFEEVPADEVEMPATKALTRAASKNNASALYSYDAGSKSWAAYEAPVAVDVLQPADYDKIGNSYISKADVTLPIYLSQAHPYAKADDVVAVAYYANKDLDVAAKEYVYDGTGWNETTVSVPSQIVFLKDQGAWMEAKIYFASTFLDGDNGGFSIHDVELSGITKVWSLEDKYGWKGTGYSGGENKETESWIVSSGISLAKAVTPKLKFEVAINYLRGAERDKYFNVFVSTNYADDVTTAKWTKLEVTGWPESDSWEFVAVEPVDLTEYKDQTIFIAFQYKSDAAAASTVEVKNMSIQE